MFVEVAIKDWLAAEVAGDLSVRALTMPVCLQEGLLHTLVTVEAAHTVMETALLAISTADRFLTVRACTFYHRITAVEVDVILNFAPLDLGFAAFFLLWTLDNQLIQNIDYDLTGRRSWP